MTTQHSVEPVSIPAQLLPSLTTNLFVQASCDEFATVAPIIAQTGVGVVYTPSLHNRHLHWPVSAVKETRKALPGANILIDLALYAGNGRKPASYGVNLDWINQQHKVMSLPWALTDSGYCRNLQDVQHVLNASALLPGQVIAVLAMPWRLLAAEAPAIRDAVNEQPHPVGVILEDAKDPFAHNDVAAGFCHLVTADRPVSLLRSDTSVLGAISHGAALGAVGTRSALRHLYPIKKRKGDEKGGPPKVDHIFLPELLEFFIFDKFRAAYFEDRSLRAWKCDRCAFCAPHPDIYWVMASADPVAEAARHALGALAHIGRQIATSAAPPPAQWSAMCEAAQMAHYDIDDPAWEAKKALGYWRGLTPTTTAI